MKNPFITSTVIWGNISPEERNHGTLKFEEGEQLNIFKLYSKSESELIMGDDDKHLNFRVSLLLDSTDVDSKKKKILITTVVTYRNWLGKIYFIPVKPFHTLIVKETLKSMTHKIESEQEFRDFEQLMRREAKTVVFPPRDASRHNN